MALIQTHICKSCGFPYYNNERTKTCKECGGQIKSYNLLKRYPYNVLANNGYCSFCGEKIYTSDKDLCENCTQEIGITKFKDNFWQFNTKIDKNLKEIDKSIKKIKNMKKEMEKYA